MTEFPDYVRTNASAVNLVGLLRNQIVDSGTCSSCGSLFVLHVCHADPPARPAKPPKIKGLRADRVILDEIDNFPGPYDELMGF